MTIRCLLFCLLISSQAGGQNKSSLFIQESKASPTYDLESYTLTSTDDGQNTKTLRQDPRLQRFQTYSVDTLTALPNAPNISSPYIQRAAINLARALTKKAVKPTSSFQDLKTSIEEQGETEIKGAPLDQLSELSKLIVYFNEILEIADSSYNIDSINQDNRLVDFNEAVAAYINEEAQQYTRNANTLSFFIDGNVQQVFTDQSNPDSNGLSTATGTLGITYHTPKTIIVANINILSNTQQEISENFGPLILNIQSGNALRSALIEWRMLGLNRRWIIRHLDLSILGGFSNSQWKYTDNEPAQNATVGYGELNFIFPFLRKNINTNKYYGAVQAGMVFRGIFGDITNGEDQDPLQIALGTSNQLFFGGNIGLEIGFNGVSGNFKVYAIGPNNNHIPGFTGWGQISAGITVSSAAFTDSW